MDRMIQLVLALLLLIFSSYSALSQDKKEPIVSPTCPCCAAPHTDFDFWEGDWVVLDTAGNKVGENTISKIEAGCLLKEKWRGQQGGTGTSINYYNRADSTWNQTWVDDKGNVLQLQGKLIDQKMVLRGPTIKGKKMNYYNQITWVANEDGTVTQLWEIYGINNKLLRTIFKGIYHRKKG